MTDLDAPVESVIDATIEPDVPSPEVAVGPTKIQFDPSYAYICLLLESYHKSPVTPLVG